MTNQQGAPEAPKVRTADYEAGWKDGYKHGAWAAQQVAPSAAAEVGTNTKTAGLLSTTVGLLMGYREGGARQPHNPGSVVAKVIDEVVDHLKDWPCPQPSPTPQADSAREAPNAMQSLTAALKADPEYAWAWHCNLAMPIMDNAKVSHRVANITAARLMQHLFYIDTEKHPHFVVADEAPQADSQPATKDLLRVALAYKDYIDALPSDVVAALPAMPGIDGDWAAEVLDRAARAPADSVTAPAGWKLVPIEPSVDQELEGKEASLRVDSMAEACKIYKAMLAAAPTTPAHAADSVLEDAAPDIDAGFEAVRRGLCKIPRYSFALDSRGNLRRCEDKSGNWIEFDAAHALFDPVAVDAARKQGGE